jgi:hypothetical protein
MKREGSAFAEYLRTCNRSLRNDRLEGPVGSKHSLERIRLQAKKENSKQNSAGRDPASICHQNLSSLFSDRALVESPHQEFVLR